MSRLVSRAGAAVVVLLVGGSTGARAGNVAVADSFNVGAGVLYQGFGILSNDDKVPLVDYRITVVQQPAHGVLTIVPTYFFGGRVVDYGNFTYGPELADPAHPSAGLFTGIDTARYCFGPAVGSCDSTTGTITFHVAPGAAPPQPVLVDTPDLVLPLPADARLLGAASGRDGNWTALTSRTGGQTDIHFFSTTIPPLFAAEATTATDLKGSDSATVVPWITGTDMTIVAGDTLGRHRYWRHTRRSKTIASLTLSQTTALDAIAIGGGLLEASTDGRVLKVTSRDSNLKATASSALATTDAQHTVTAVALGGGGVLNAGSVPLVFTVSAIDRQTPPPHDVDLFAIYEMATRTLRSPFRPLPEQNPNREDIVAQVLMMPIGLPVLIEKQTWAGGLDPTNIGFKVLNTDGSVRVALEDVFPDVPREWTAVRAQMAVVAPDAVAVAAELQNGNQHQVVMRTVDVFGELSAKEVKVANTTNPVLQLGANNGFGFAMLGLALLQTEPELVVSGSGPGLVRANLVFPQTCAASATTLCLNNNRFRVDVTDVDHSNVFRVANGVKLTDDTGYFTFFDPKNVELVLKVINGCGLGGHYWIFAGGLTDVLTNVTVTDSTTGQMVVFTNPQGKPFQPYQNTAAFACTTGAAAADENADIQELVDSAVAAAAQPAPFAPPANFPAATANCHPDDTHLCLNGGRFEVSTSYQTGDGLTGAGHAVPIAPAGVAQPDTGYFWFFSSSNVEEVLKVIDGCGLNQRFWVFAGGLTNVKVTTTVRDTSNGTTRTYVNPASTAFAPVQETSAFATCP